PIPWSPRLSSGALLLLIELELIHALPWFRIPPPEPPTAWFPVTELPVIVRLPPFAIPPAPPSGPPKAVLPVTWLFVTVNVPPPPRPPLPLPLAMPPPPGAAFPLTVLLSMTAVPLWFRIPPPPPSSATLFVTMLEFSVSIPDGVDNGVPVAIPPPALAVLPVTRQLFNVSVALKLEMPPPAPEGPMPLTLPPVIVREFRTTVLPAETVSGRPADCASSVAVGDPFTVTFADAVNVPSHVPLTFTVPPPASAA